MNEDDLRFVWCPKRKRRALLNPDDRCQYCQATGHKKWDGGAFDLPTMREDENDGT